MYECEPSEIQHNGSSCDKYKIHLLHVLLGLLCGLYMSYLHVKINQNHVGPILVKTTFPLMNTATATATATLVHIHAHRHQTLFFLLLSTTFICVCPKCVGILNEEWEVIQDLCTIIHCYIRNVWFLNQKYEHASHKIRLSANQCVAMSVWFMAGSCRIRSGKAEIIYELIAIIAKCKLSICKF